MAINPFFKIPLFPTFDVPETFGKALSYEGQLHALCHAFSDITDGYNQIINYVNDAFPWEFADDINWDQSAAYPAHVIVYDENTGRSYVSIQDVPAGISIGNEDYWVPLASLNAGIGTYRITDFTGVRNDGVECTSAIQAAIDSIPEGSTVIFPTGTYLVTTIQLKSGIEYDFDGSTLQFTGAFGLRCEGTTKGTYLTSAAYVAGSYSLPVTMTGTAIGDLVVVSDTAELFSNARSYYYRGGTFQICRTGTDSVDVSNPMPLPMASGAQVRLVDPARVYVHDIASLEYVGSNPGNAYGVFLTTNSGSVIERVNSTSEMYAQVYLQYCYKCTLRQCVTGLYSTLANSYCVIVGSCTACEVDHCDFTGSWSAISPGLHEPNYGCWYHDSNLQCVGDGATQYAYGAHENDYDPVIERCIIDGVNVANSATLRDCVIHFNQANYCNVLLSSYPECGHMTFDNCRFVRNEGARNRVRFAVYPQTMDVPSYHQGSVDFIDCVFDERISPESTDGTVVGFVAAQELAYVIDSLTFRNCRAFQLMTAPSSTSTNTAIRRLELDNVTFQTYTRTDFYSVEELYWHDSTIYRGFASTLFNVGPGVTAHIDNVGYEPSDGTNANGKIAVNQGAVAYLANVTNDCTAPNFVPQAGSEVHLTNCRLDIYQWATVKPSLNLTGDAIDRNGVRRIYEHYNGTQYQGYFDGTGYVFS